jgi:biotin carboxyl carrier protein
MEFLSNYSMVKKQIILMLVTVSALVQCTTESQPETKASEETNKSVSWVTEAPIWTAAIEETQFNARYEAIESGKAAVAFPTAVRVDELRIRPGQSVSKGMPIAIVSHPVIAELEREYFETKEVFEVAQASFSRWSKIQSEGGASELEWKQAIQDKNTAKAAYESAIAMLGSYGIVAELLDKVSNTAVVLAPISGQVQQLNVGQGAFLPAETPLTEVVAEVQGRVYAEVAPEIARDLKVATEVVVSNGAEQFAGELRAISGQSENDGLVSVWIDIDNPSGLIYGSPVSVQAHSIIDSAWSVSEAALLYEGSQPFVVIEELDQLKKAEITLTHQGKGRIFFKETVTGKVVIEQANRAIAAIEG